MIDLMELKRRLDEAIRKETLPTRPLKKEIALIVKAYAKKGSEELLAIAIETLVKREKLKK